MADKLKNRYLYLALVCFLGIMAIFIVDGYMGIYDTVYITSGEQEQNIEADFWLRDYNVGSVWTEGGQKVFFRYEVDNRLFSSYSAGIEVSLWSSKQKVLDLLSQQIEVASFSKEQVEFVVNTAELEQGSLERGVEYTILIKRGEVERSIILYLSPSPVPKIPPPTR